MEEKHNIAEIVFATGPYPYCSKCKQLLVYPPEDVTLSTNIIDQIDKIKCPKCGAAFVAIVNDRYR